MSEYLIRHGVDSNRLQVAPLGVDTSSSPDLTREEVLRLMPGFNYEQDCLVVSVSSNHPVKRLNDLKNLLVDCATNEFPIFWLHLGAVLDNRSVLNYAFRMNSVENVPHHQVLQILKALRKYFSPIVVNYSASEGVPISLVEAGLSGIPFIGCEIGGIPSLMPESAQHLLSSHSTPESLRILLIDILSNYSERSEIFSSFLKLSFDPEITFSNFYSSILSIDRQ